MVLISRSESTETTGETPEVCVTQQPAQSLLHEPEWSLRPFHLQARANADTPRHSWKVCKAGAQEGERRRKSDLQI